MRKSVKYVAALLAATMTIGGLTGCVNSASSDTGSNGLQGATSGIKKQVV